MDLADVHLELNEEPQAMRLTGRESATLRTRPLRAEDVHFGSYTSAIRHLDPPQLFESRPSYRYLSGFVDSTPMTFGLAAYFDKLDVSEALGHEMAIACMDGIPSDVAALRGRLPFRELIGDPFDSATRAI
ncbi:MAG: XRE family transcriptional regulator, partial [Pseudonocardiaceae bacterium]|nr:XRE family transcriptional regulator [Pseudonocardiaceae bacterium]